MPPKKTATNGEVSEGAFKWEGANDFKLLLLIQGRHAMPDEYEQLATAFPGVSTGGIRNRISNLRVKQRELYDSLSWTLPESVAANAGKRASKATKKRSADESDATGDAAETPVKKARSKKVKKEEVVEKNEKNSGAEVEEGIKAECVEDEEF